MLENMTQTLSPGLSEKMHGTQWWT